MKSWSSSFKRKRRLNNDRKKAIRKKRLFKELLYNDESQPMLPDKRKDSLHYYSKKSMSCNCWFCRLNAAESKKEKLKRQQKRSRVSYVEDDEE